MINCPLCEGTTMTRISSAGEETWCTSCRNILASATFGFKIANANIESCSVGGLPGYKGPGEGAKCYTFEPGNDAQEKRAQQKAAQSAYMGQRNAHVENLVTANPIWDAFPNKIVGDQDEEKEVVEASVLDKIIPATHETEDGVEVGGLEDVGSGKTIMSRKFHPSFFADSDELSHLGRGYCTNCSGDHEVGMPCELN